VASRIAFDFSEASSRKRLNGLNAPTRQQHQHQYQPQRRPGRRDQQQPGEGADRVDLAVREVDDVEHAEDQRESDRHQRIDETDRQAVDDLLQQDSGIHRRGQRRATAR
jgi:hypothetical protein